MTTMAIRDASLYVEVIGSGYPLALMHGGPGLDHWSLLPFRRCSDQFTLVFYDHRCNGRSEAPLASMTMDNLTADADALRERLGFERWAVLGHSFGGMVALEYALRYPDRLSHLVLMDTGGDVRWPQREAPRILAGRGYSPAAVRAARRFFDGQITPGEFLPALMRFGSAYGYQSSLVTLAREMFQERGMKVRPETAIFGCRETLRGWSVMDRLGEVAAPTLVIAGRDDFLFPPEHQVELARGIPNARLRIIERAGHNPQSERPDQVMAALREFIPVQAPALAGAASGG